MIPDPFRDHDGVIVRPAADTACDAIAECVKNVVAMAQRTIDAGPEAVCMFTVIRTGKKDRWQTRVEMTACHMPGAQIVASLAGLLDQLAAHLHFPIERLLFLVGAIIGEMEKGKHE